MRIACFLLLRRFPAAPGTYFGSVPRPDGRGWLALVAVLVLCGTAMAQQFEIRGSVVEPPANLGIAGAEVTLTEFVEDDTKTVVRKPSATTATDARGAFVFHPDHVGDFYVEVKKTGYSNLNAQYPGGAFSDNPGTPVSLNREHPAAQVGPFSLSRPGELSGRVIDDNGKPVGGLTVWVQNPLREAFLSAPTVTDKEGSFTITKLAPGDYVVRIGPQSGNLETVTPRFVDDDLKVVDQDLEISYWPGGTPDSRTATPMRVSPGASSSVGTIVARKVPYYRVRVSVRQANCADEKWTFSVLTASNGYLDVLDRGYGVLPCTNNFMVGHLKAGSYWFALTNGLDGQGTMWALVPVEIADKNLSVELTLERSIDVAGRAIGFEGSALPPAKSFGIRLAPINGLNRFAPAALDSEGRFLLKNVLWPRQRILVDLRDSSHYVKEIRYSNAPVLGSMITPTQGAQLEVVFDDKPASVTGSVTDGDKPVGKSTVFLTKWPVSSENLQINGADTSSDGKFQILGVAPGEYRAIALPPLSIADGAKLNNDLLARLLSRGEKITLERGGSQSVTLKLSDPLR